jgi:hypothetical protein
MTEQEAIEIAKKFAEDQGWDWIEPVRAEYRRPWFGKGGWWNIWDDQLTIGGNSYIKIDDTTGKVIEKQNIGSDT